MKHAHSVNYHFSRPFCVCMCVAYHQTKDKIADDFHLSLPFLTLAKPRKDKARGGVRVWQSREGGVRALRLEKQGKGFGKFLEDTGARVVCLCASLSDDFSFVSPVYPSRAGKGNTFVFARPRWLLCARYGSTGLARYPALRFGETK